MKYKRIIAAFIAILLLSGYFPAGVKAAETERSSIEMNINGLEAFSLSDITLYDDYLTNAYEKETAYLLSLDPDRLLAGFRDTAGVDMRGVTRYNGWENSLIGGHTLGHYLTACVQAYENAGADAELKAELFEIVKALVNGLKECQDAVGTGFIFGSTVLSRENIELQFDNVESGKANITTQAWVPWYTMHKIFEGLISAASMQDEAAEEVAATALETAKKLGDWVYKRTSGWSAATRRTVLSIEYGGMNDALYDLYILTGNADYKAAAEQFNETALFESVLKAEPGDNVLNDKHANTTIPKFMGALKAYVADPSQTVFLDYAKAFWTLVTEEHSYITGGNSEWEHFGKDSILDAERTNANCETCNAYNMLKLTKLLYMITGDAMYADWYENTYINSILSSQNPETGMTTYFQAMASGYFKVYGEEDTDFWCCTGTGMENFTKLGESFYFKKDNTLIVDQYFSSKLDWKEKGAELALVADLPENDTVTVTVKGSIETLLFRLPSWLASEALITVNGETVNYAVTGESDASNGYAVLKEIKDGSVIKLTLPMEVVAYGLPDGENTFAFKYGPVVLSAALGTDSMEKTTTGVDVDIPKSRYFNTDYLPSSSEKVTVTAGSLEQFIEKINEYMVRDESADKLTFNLTGTDSNLKFVTHYTQYTERYAIYLKFSDDTSALSDTAVLTEKTAARKEAMLLDTVQPGYGQYENDENHRMTENGTGSVGRTDSGTLRYALVDGSFAYSMAVDTKGSTLVLTLDHEDAGKSLIVTAGGEKVLETTVANGIGSYDVYVELSAEVLKNAKDGRIEISFTGADGEESAAVRNFIYTMKALSTATDLTVTDIGTGALYYNESRNKYTLKVDAYTKTADVSFSLPGKFAYLTVNGAVKDESRPITLASGKGYLLTVYAEDHSTCEQYAFEVSSENETEEDTALVYFVDCGDHGTDTVSEGDSFGTHNSVTEQVYGRDKTTGYVWGLVDETYDQYGGTSVSAGVYTANTWCYEFNTKEDGLAKDATNRYTKNQYESGIPRHLDYSFELEDGEYEVEIGFANPWNCSQKPTVYAYYGQENEQILLKKFDVLDESGTANVTVSGGKLDLNIKSDDLCINLTYIKISKVNVTGESHGRDVLILGTDKKTEPTQAATPTSSGDITFVPGVIPEEEKKGANPLLIAIPVGLAAIAGAIAFIFKRKK